MFRHRVRLLRRVPGARSIGGVGADTGVPPRDDGPLPEDLKTKPCRPGVNGHTEIILIEAAAVSTATLKQRLFTICFLTASAIAMLGWLAALGWAAVAVTNWLFF
jgi:hypothetical protein